MTKLLHFAPLFQTIDLLRGTSGGTQHRNTVRNIGKYRNTVSKIDKILILHLWSVTFMHQSIPAAPSRPPVWPSGISILFCLGWEIPWGGDSWAVLRQCCSQSPIFSWDCLDIPIPCHRHGYLDFKCTKGAGVGDYSSIEGGGGRKIEGL